MAALRWVAPTILAVVMAAAAGAKLARPRATSASFADLGLPAPVPLAWGVPAVELTIAVLLVAVPTPGAVLAIAVLLAFSAFLATRLSQGDPTPCACFGQVRARPIGRRDLLRNAGLLGLALVTLGWPPA